MSVTPRNADYSLKKTSNDNKQESEKNANGLDVSKAKTSKAPKQGTARGDDTTGKAYIHGSMGENTGPELSQRNNNLGDNMNSKNFSSEADENTIRSTSVLGESAEEDAASDPTSQNAPKEDDIEENVVKPGEGAPSRKEKEFPLK